MEVFGSQYLIIQVWFALILFYQVEKTIIVLFCVFRIIKKSSLVLSKNLLLTNILKVKAIQIWEVLTDLVELRDAW